MKVSKNPEIDPDLQRLGQLEPLVSVLFLGVGVVLDFCLLLICVCVCVVYVCIHVYKGVCIYMYVRVHLNAHVKARSGCLMSYLITSYVLR